MSAEIYLPSIMQIGAGAIKHLPKVLENLAVQRPCIITDNTMLELGVVKKLQEILLAHHIDVAVFSEVMQEPDDKSIAIATSMVAEGNFDCIIALGGGSAIDSAKAIALLATHGGHMRDYKVPLLIRQQSMPVIAIPTTAGTGSECTRVTIICDSVSSEKMLCMGPGLMPKAAIVDYELTLTVPFRVAADTGIDALTHAIEAYVSKKASLFTDQHATSAMKLIAQNLLEACFQPDHREAKEAMMLGSCMAGIAFSNASVALVHGMSRPLGVHFHVPHGLSNAMLLPTITAFSLSGNPRKYAECALHMGLIDTIVDEAACHRALIDFLTMINKKLKVPSMTEYGIVKADYIDVLDTMAEQALASGSPSNNPLVPTFEQIKQLYVQVYT
ncbi:iron-containing alcohol dehydrogenase [Glaciecola sp. SC05]|uniref:iron-containing alcohol dehydrogenase n=1 Tax=Glaciecola sp. SC05 TaxID=1987355 RepID=UPI00352944DD